MTDSGIKALIHLEARRLRVYLDSSGFPTIGCGHLLTKDERTSGKIRIGDLNVEYRHGLTVAQSTALLALDLAGPVAAVRRLVTVPLNSNQEDALTSFIFNIGVSAFRNSTLRKQLNAGDVQGVPAQMRRWIYSAGKKVQGLINRREAEIALWHATVKEKVREPQAE